MTEYGTYRPRALANGLTGPESTERCDRRYSDTVQYRRKHSFRASGAFTALYTDGDLERIHPEGFKEGLTGTDGKAAIGDGISGMLDSARSWLDKLFPDR